MTWLGMHYQDAPLIFLKPSPVHALAALCMALGDGQETALTQAVDLVRTGQAGSAWQRLQGAQAYVFEDSPGGIKSLQAARMVLDEVGIHFESRNFGIARNPAKIRALRENDAEVFPSLVEALQQVVRSI